MCLFSAPKAPEAPALPPPVAPPPTPVDAAVVRARQISRQRAALAGGRQDTILTSPQGATDEATVAAAQLSGANTKKTLLGA